MVDFTYSISPADLKVTEGGSFTVTITPKAALNSDVTIRWVIVPKGKLPISGSDFSSLTGTYDFDSGDDGDDGHTFTFTPSDDNILEPGKDFEIFFYQVVGNDDYTGTETDDELIGSSQVHLADDETGGDVNTVKFPGTSGENILTLGTTDDLNVANNNGNDVYIITQHQYGDVTISDVAPGATGSNLIKLDYGVTITDVSETATDLSFLGLGVTYDAIVLTLSTGAEITITSPEGTHVRYQLGSGSKLTYAAFKTAIGANGIGDALTFGDDYSVTSYGAKETGSYSASVTQSNLPGTANVDIYSFGSDEHVTKAGAGQGDDVYIITQHQYGDVTIDDVASSGSGSNLIKLDYGVTITDVSETATDLSFLGLGVTYDAIVLTLSTGADITIKSPEGAHIRYQLGDGAIIDYAAFKTAIGASGIGDALTFGDDYTIAFPSTNTAPTVTGTPSVDVTEDTAKTDFAASDFNFDDTDSGDTLKAVKITALPGAGTLELGSDANHNGATTYTAVTAGQSIAAADIAKLRYTPAANATAATSFKFKVVDNHDAESTEATMAISISAVDDAPVFSSVTATASVAESLATGSDVGLKFVATDVDNTLSASDFAVYERNSANTGWATTVSTLFEVVADSSTTNGWKIKLKTGQSLDYETASSIKLRVTAREDGAASANQDNFVLSVTDANDAPSVSGAISVALSGTIGQSLSEDLVKAGRFVVSDQDGDTPSYSIVKASDNSAISWLAVDSGGTLSFATGNNAPGIWQNGTHSLKLKVSDGNGGIAYSAAFTLNLGKTEASANFPTNPFSAIDINSYITPTFVDLDGDGDMDLVSGRSSGHFVAWRKDADGSYSELTGSNNPFNGLDAGNWSVASFVDIDGDGDLDLVSGEGNGAFKVWRNNNGTSYTELTGGSNPLNGIDAGNESAPTFVDIDGDGDMDFVSGDVYGEFKAWRKDTTGYTQLTDSNNPFDDFGGGSFSAPTFVDLDGDGDMDLVRGDNNGGFRVWFKQTDGSYGTTSNAFFGTPFNDVINGTSASESLVGGAGNDILDGGTGADTLFGGTGKDTLTGGTGDDIFGIADTATTAGAADIIKDFATGTNQMTVDSAATHIWWDVRGGNTRVMGGTSSAAATDKFYAILEGYTGGLDADDFTNSGLTVARINTAPTLTASGTGSIAENVATQTQTGISFVASDSETTPAASWFTVYEGASGTTESTRFDVIDDSGTFKLVLLAGNALNYETTQSISLRVKISDGALDSTILPLTIAVTDVNEFAPVIAQTATTQGGGTVSFASDTFSVSYAEGAKSRYVLDLAATDADGSQTPKFRLKADATHGKANSLFTMSDDGILRFKADADFENLDTGKINAGSKARGHIDVSLYGASGRLTFTAKNPGVAGNFRVNLIIKGGLGQGVTFNGTTMRIQRWHQPLDQLANWINSQQNHVTVSANSKGSPRNNKNYGTDLTGGTDSYYAVYAEAYDADTNARTDDVKIKIKVTDVANANLPPADDTLPALPENSPSLTGKTISGDSHVTESEATPRNDYIFGTPGDDILRGGAGDDVLMGGAGNDILNGGSGDDILVDGAGADTLTGGAGDDIFKLDIASSETKDAVTDFGTGTDKIRVDTTAGNETTLTALQNAANIRWTNDTNEATGSTNDANINDTVIYNTKGTADTSDDVIIMVLEDYTTALTINDFEIV